MEGYEPVAQAQLDKLSSFMDILHEPAVRAQQFLQATNWQLEEAIQLYFAQAHHGGLGSLVASSSMVSTGAEPSYMGEQDSTRMSAPKSLKSQLDESIRPPIPVKRETLYEAHIASRLAETKNVNISVHAFRNFEEESVQHPRRGIESMERSSAAPDGGHDSLAALYRPPFVLMFVGTFEQAKDEAVRQGKWLLVNLQSTREFSSYTLNRDTWAHEAVRDTIGTSFVFWQIYDDTEEGKKVCTFYKLSNMPTTLILDPLTGQKMRAWAGMISAERLLEDLVPYLDRGPADIQPARIPPPKRAREEMQKAIHFSGEAERGASMHGEVTLSQAVEVIFGDDNLHLSTSNLSGIETKYPVLPDEPRTDAHGSCRVAVRLPDGRRVQRRFLLADPLQFLWLFCTTQLNENDTPRSFRLTHTMPGKTATIDCASDISIQDAGIENSVLVMSWL